MKILDILDESITDGDGIRTVIFFSGCPHACVGCHNPDSWDINNGREMSVRSIADYVDDLYDITLSGGDPLFQHKECIELAKELKLRGKNIWLYSGYTYEEISSNKNLKNILDHIDVLVDGRFELKKKDLTLRFRGSSNQRVIYL